MPITRFQLAEVAAVTLLLLAPAAAQSPASQVQTGANSSPSHWSRAPVAALRSAGILSAEPFAPDTRITTAAWTDWLCRAGAWPEPPDCAAASASVADTTHHVTRSNAVELALPLAAYVLMPKAELSPALQGRSDAPTLSHALRAGLLTGDDAGRLAPDRLLTHAEAAVVVGRVVINRQAKVPWELEPDRQSPLDKVRLFLHPELSGPHRQVTVATGEGRLVAAPVRVADTPLTLQVGAESGLGSGLLLVGTSGIHTRWGPVPLDVVFLSRDDEILALYPELPRGVVRSRLGAVRALELPGGTLAAVGLREGDRLQITPR